MTEINKIIHIDCDCFFAAIEMRDNPGLSDLPVAVGGLPERRGVIATCNYAARQFGVHSAMASATARKRCPNLVIVRPDMARYRAVSRQIHDIFSDYTAVIEPLSLDEAFLDVTGSSRYAGSASQIASEIRSRIAEEIGITVSAGIAPNKFLAKIASDWNKPNGQFVIMPDQVDEFVRKLPVKKLYGVGQVTAARMHELGIDTCSDLRALSQAELAEQFGSFGRRLYQLCRGIDQRPVQTSRVRKSISVENTYPQDLADLQACCKALPDLHRHLLRRMQSILSSYRVTKQVVKIKFHDFVSTTVETLSSNTDLENYRTLLGEGFARGNRPVRLLGIGARLAPRDSEQPAGVSEPLLEASCSATKEIQLALSLEQKS
jgi:DNA polymerase-4